MEGTLNTELAFSARAVKEVIARNPKSWQFEEIRLQEILERRLDNTIRVNGRVRDLHGRVIAETKESLARPILTFSQPVYNSGMEAARVEIERSISHVVTNTVLLGICSTLSGILFFLIFHFLPLRTIRAAYDKLLKSESFFKEITDNASDVIFITDENGDTKYCSRSVERFLGYTPEELIGKSAFALIHPDDLERAFNDYREALLSKDKAIPNAFRVLHKDGSERYFEGLGRNLLDNPLISGFIMNVYDSTARRRMEEELKENTLRYKQLFDNANVGIYRIDFRTGKISDANNYFLEYTGYSREELNTLSPYDILTEDSKKRFAERLEKRSRGEKVPETVEYDVIDKKGNQRCVYLNNKDVYDAQGRVIGCEVVAQDITQRKLEANALRESERQYRLIAEKMTDIVWIADMNLRTLYITPSVQKVLGFSPEEIPKTIDGQMTPESINIAMEMLAKELAVEEQGDADPNRSISFVAEYYHKDGSTRWLEAIVTGLRDNNGALTGLHGVSRDITERKLAEEALSRSEEKHRTIIENIEDGYAEVDLKGNFLFVNNALCKIDGYPKNELIKLNYRDFMDEENAKRIYETYHKVFITGESEKNIEYEIITKNGIIKYLETSVSPIKDADNRVIAFRGIVRDRTERKKAEEKFHKIFMTSPDGIAIVRIGDGIVIDVNKGFEDIIGWRREQVIGTKTTDPTFNFWVNLSDRSFMLADLQAGRDVINYEFEFRRSDGSVHTGICSARPINIGEEECIIFILQDITERKLAEEKFYKIFMTTPDCIAITRLKDGLIKDVNRGFEDIVGWQREVAIGTKSSERPLNFWADPSERDFLVAELGAGGDVLHRQIAFRRRDGSVRDGMYSARSINMDNEESLIFILQDVTEQKRMEKELVESQKTKLMNQIASGVAHEVRNPLHAIQAISEAMAIDMDEKSDYRDYLMHIKTQVERLSRLMNDLLDLGKPIQSSLFNQVLLTEIATASLGYWMEAHPQLSHQIKIINNLPQDDFVLADSSKIQQVIINLMENAAQNSPKDEIIILALSKASEDYLMVEIIDRGAGLKSQDPSKVFEPFYTTRKGGTGLGLSLCKHIIENHGGTIEIANNKDAPGCTARFTIPFYSGEEHA